MPTLTPDTISLDELVTRVQAAARKMGTKNPHRLLLLNTAAALSALGQQLEQAWNERDAVGDTARMIHLPGGGQHHVT